MNFYRRNVLETKTHPTNEVLLDRDTQKSFTHSQKTTNDDSVLAYFFYIFNFQEVLCSIYIKAASVA